MATLQIPKAAGSVTSVNSKTGVVSLSTNDIPEYNSLYFSLVRAASAISLTNTAGTSKGIDYVSGTGVISVSADYLLATPYTLVLRDSSGNIISNLGTFNNVTVNNVLSCFNAIHTGDLYVSGQLYAAGGTSIKTNVSYSDFAIDTVYVNGANTTYVSAVLSLSSQNDTLPIGGILIDPAGGTSFTISIPVRTTGNIIIDASGTTLSGAQVQTSAWIAPNASYKFTMISGVAGQQSVSIISNSCQTVTFSATTV